jgi:hypothetical protein
MPRYFFHVIDGREILDYEGTELSDLREARAEAIRTAGAQAPLLSRRSRHRRRPYVSYRPALPPGAERTMTTFTLPDPPSDVESLIREACAARERHADEQVAGHIRAVLSCLKSHPSSGGQANGACFLSTL